MPAVVTPDLDSADGLVIVNVVAVGTVCTSKSFLSNSAAEYSVFAPVKEPAFAKVVISPTSKL